MDGEIQGFEADSSAFGRKFDLSRNQRKKAGRRDSDNRGKGAEGPNGGSVFKSLG